MQWSINSLTSSRSSIPQHAAMAASAIRLLEDDALAVRLGRNGREACVKFTWPAVRDAWLAAYHDLAQAGKTRAA